MAPPENGQPPKGNDTNGNQGREHVHARVQPALAAVALAPVLQKLPVLLGELLLLSFLAHKGLDYPDTGQGVLSLGVDAGHALPGAGHGSAHNLVEMQGVQQHKGQGPQDNQGSLPADPHENHSSANQLDAVGQQILRHMVKKLCQGQGVIGDAGHQAAHSVLVIIPEGQDLAMLKQALAHVALDFCPQIMSLIVVKIGAQCLYQHQHSQAQGCPQEPAELGQACVQQAVCHSPHPQRYD